MCLEMNNAVVIMNCYSHVVLNIKSKTNTSLKGVKNVHSATKFCSYYFGYYVSYEINGTGTLLKSTHLTSI